MFVLHKLFIYISSNKVLYLLSMLDPGQDQIPLIALPQQEIWDEMQAANHT